MKAHVLDRYGAAARLRAAEVPEPTLGETDVLIRVGAAGVNPLDIKIRDGAFKALMKFEMPLIVGNDVAGVVERTGARATRFKRGDEVFARTDTMRMGGFAELVAVGEHALSRKPSTLDMVQAAGVPLVALTAYQALVERAKLKRGQKLLVLAGSGGVGTMAIQLAKHLGAEVATTAGASSAAMLKALGADRVIDYRHEDFSAGTADYDVVLDTQGGAETSKCLRVLKKGGIVVNLAGPPDASMAKEIGGGRAVALLLNLLSFRVRRQAKRLGVTYSFLFMRPDGAQLETIAGLIESGALAPVVDRTFAFAHTQEALAYVEGGRAKGKVVIEIA